MFSMFKFDISFYTIQSLQALQLIVFAAFGVVD